MEKISYVVDMEGVFNPCQVNQSFQRIATSWFSNFAR
jgi:hypothetical protein